MAEQSATFLVILERKIREIVTISDSCILQILVSLHLLIVIQASNFNQE